MEAGLHYGFFGFGVMGEAIATGLRGVDPTCRFSVAEPREERRSLAADRFAAEVVSGSTPALYSSCDVVILAVKPQDLSSIPRSPESTREPVLVSILAGTPISRLADTTGLSRIARLMPNVAGPLHKAAVGVAFGASADKEAIRRATAVASALGTVYEVPEYAMAAVTGVSGSGIAYAFAFAHALALGGVAEGLKYSTAAAMAADVLDGAAGVLRSCGASGAEMVTSVTSAAGTTIRGIEALERGAFGASVIAAVRAAAERARELE